MTDREKLVELISDARINGHRVDDLFYHDFAEDIADHLIANGATVQPSPQINHRKICPTTGLECIACVPGSPCATEDDQLKNDLYE